MTVASQAAALAWKAMADQETYYPLRDGPRLYTNKSALKTLRPRMSADMMDASDWLVRQFEAAEGIAKGSGERVDGGTGNGAELAAISQTDGSRASEAAIHAVMIRSMVRHAGPILRRTHDHDRLTVADVARWKGLGHETAARAILSVIETLAAYREDCKADARRWAA